MQRAIGCTGQLGDIGRLHKVDTAGVKEMPAEHAGNWGIAMQLGRIADGVEMSGRMKDMEITGLAYYIREVEKGCLFCCPAKDRAMKRAAMAVAKGAKILLCEKRMPLPVHQIIVPDALSAMKRLCVNYLSILDRELTVIGVTGTNGKTTTTYMIKSVLEANGISTGLIGTVECLAGDEKLGATITTPFPSRLIKLFSHMIEKGCRTVVMECSSEGLAEDRMDGIHFSVGVFTNLTQDHLDYHGTMEKYASDKRKLFAQCKAAVFNADSDYTPFMREGFSGTVLTYGIRQNADVKAVDIRYAADRSEFVLNSQGNSFPAAIEIPGAFNVYNALACFSACSLLGMKAEDIIKGMHAIRTVPGRIERIPTPGQPFTVVLDYAHTPAGLENILHALRDITKGRIITVFGCGGKRDRTKRPVMGETAGRLSDYCFVTSDNPRTEKPMDIIQDILPGLKKSGCAFEVEPDRRTAIEKAVRFAGAGDTVLLAGKGHEQFQEIQGVKRPFDEHEIVRETLEKMQRKAE